MIGSTAMMITAIGAAAVVEIDEHPLNMRLASTGVHWPLVMAKMMSKTLRTTMVMVHTTRWCL
jgi:hypothetical protein